MENIKLVCAILMIVTFDVIMKVHMDNFAKPISKLKIRIMQSREIAKRKKSFGLYV